MRALLSPKSSRHGFGLQLRRSSLKATTGFVIALAGARLLQHLRFPRSLWRHHLLLECGLRSFLFRSSMTVAIRYKANQNGGTAPLLSSALISAGGDGYVVKGRMEEGWLCSLARWVRWRLRRQTFFVRRHPLQQSLDSLCLDLFGTWVRHLCFILGLNLSNA